MEREKFQTLPCYLQLSRGMRLNGCHGNVFAVWDTFDMSENASDNTRKL